MTHAARATFDAAVPRLHAEPDVLRTWARASENPRLAGAYIALADRVARRVPDAPPQPHEAIHDEHETAAAITVEPARLKWLLDNRRARAAHPAFAALSEHRAADLAEAEGLAVLLTELVRGLC